MRKASVGKILVAMLLLIALINQAAALEKSCKQCHESISVNYTTSLHHTAKGIDTAFKQASGKTFGINTPQKCMECHVENCSYCHRIHKQMPNMTDCITCHRHQIGVNYIGYLVDMMKRAKQPDVHYTNGLKCLDCHSSTEIHGDGNTYVSGIQAVKIKCEACHFYGVKIGGKKAKLYDKNILAHKLHRDISCFSCHVAYYQNCYNCHLDTGKLDKMTTSEFHILSYNGKLYPAHVMVTSYGGKMSKCAGVVTPHTITPKAKDCSDCHDNQEKVFLVGFDGNLVGPPGVHLANPPSKLEVDLGNFGINLKLDITQIGTLIILGALGFLAVHLIRRRITLGRWIG